MIISCGNSKKKSTTTKREDESPLSSNHSKSVRYRKRVQEELEANEEIRIYKLVNDEDDLPDNKD